MMMENRAQAFLWYSYFGYTKEKLDTMTLCQAAQVCAVRAYRDMNRTLRFVEKSRHDEFCKKVCEVIVKYAKQLIGCKNQDRYNNKHKDACLEIMQTADQQGVLKNGFTYGQAQNG